MKPIHILAIAAIPVVLFAGFLLVLFGIGAGGFAAGGSAGAPSGTWASSFEEARARSAESGKPVLAVFSASWCPPCQQMKRNIYPLREVDDELYFNWVPVYIDVDDYGPLAQRYGVRGVPTFVMIGSDGEVFDRFSGGTRTGDDFIRRINQRR